MEADFQVFFSAFYDQRLVAAASTLVPGVLHFQFSSVILLKNFHNYKKYKYKIQNINIICTSKTCIHSQSSNYKVLWPRKSQALNKQENLGFGESQISMYVCLKPSLSACAGVGLMGAGTWTEKVK